MGYMLPAIVTMVCVTMAQATILVGSGSGLTGLSIGTATTSTSLATLAAGAVGVVALGAGALALKALVASRNRSKREVTSGMEDAIWSIVGNSDPQGCALKLICLLEGKDDSELSDEERLIVELFGNDPVPVTGDDLRTPRAPFFYSAYMGNKFGSDACNKLFHSCSLQLQEMMDFINQLNSV